MGDDGLLEHGPTVERRALVARGDRAHHGELRGVRGEFQRAGEQGTGVVEVVVTQLDQRLVRDHHRFVRRQDHELVEHAGRVDMLLGLEVGDGKIAQAKQPGGVRSLGRRLGDRRSTAELLLDSARASQSGSFAAIPVPELENPRRGMRIARKLAKEIGWQEGIALSRGETDSE